jgi:hypothetical protein
LVGALEISECKVDLLAILRFSWDQSQAFETLKRSEYVYR